MVEGKRGSLQEPRPWEVAKDWIQSKSEAQPLVGAEDRGSNAREWEDVW